VSAITTHLPENKHLDSHDRTPITRLRQHRKRYARKSPKTTESSRFTSNKITQLLHTDAKHPMYLKFNSNTDPPLSLQTASVGSSVN